MQNSAVYKISRFLETKTPKSRGCDFGFPHNGSGKVYRISYSQSHTIRISVLSNVSKILASKNKFPGV